MDLGEEVLTYWFGTSDDDATVRREQGPLWFAGGDAVDAEIAARFSERVAAAARGELDVWAATPRGRLALIILLDQFTRNLQRGTARAFENDARALDLARTGVAAGDDRALRPVERGFLYLPFMHSEQLADHEQSLALFQRLVEETAGGDREAAQGSLGYARAHRDLIARFGRYPHRNTLLGRESTPEETAYLDGGGETFGQTRK